MAMYGRRLAVQTASIVKGRLQIYSVAALSIAHNPWQSSAAGAENGAANGRSSSRIRNVVRHMSSDMSALPPISDPQVKEAFNALMAASWNHLDKNTRTEVHAALSKQGQGSGQDALKDLHAAAVAVEKFCDNLTALKMELDELSGGSGEAVGKLPDLILQALEAAFTKYSNYLASFDEDEAYLRKKVENELGYVLLNIRQRCSGLDPKWAQLTLLGTSGLSGSYVEHRG